MRNLDEFSVVFARIRTREIRVTLNVFEVLSTELLQIEFLEFVLDDVVQAPIKKVALEGLVAQHVGKPVGVVWPHLVEGYALQVVPLRPHF